MKLLAAICLSVLGCVGTAYAAEPEGETYLPISFKCPSDNDQTLELVERRRSGKERLVRAQYVNNVASIVGLFLGKKGSFEPIMGPIDIRSEADPGKKRYAELIAKRADELKAICEGSAQERSDYSDTLKANRKAGCNDNACPRVALGEWRTCLASR